MLSTDTRAHTLPNKELLRQIVERAWGVYRSTPQSDVSLQNSDLTIIITIITRLTFWLIIGLVHGKPNNTHGPENIQPACPKARTMTLLPRHPYIRKAWSPMIPLRLARYKMMDSTRAPSIPTIVLGHG